MTSLSRLFTELQRRRVLRVVGAYAVAAWVIVEVWTTIQPILLSPGSEWTNKLVVTLVLLGFPVVFALAWIFDITPQGVRRTEAAVADDVAAPPRHIGPLTLSPRASGFFGLGILVALVSFAAYAGYDGTRPRSSDTATQIRSIAVLPFEDMSSTRDQEFFSHGIAEELLNRLTEVADLQVSSRTSSFALAAQELDVQQIGQRLNVQAVLEGSVRREQNQVRVTVRLTNATNGSVIWNATFDGVATNVFALQDSISSNIVQKLRVQFAMKAEAGKRGTTNARAYELYTLGLSRWHNRTDRDLRQALQYFHNAIKEDSTFALAYAALAQTYAVLPAFGDFPVDTAAMQGYAAATQAISLDPTLAHAYAAMGQIIQNFEWDLSGAERHYQRALHYADDVTSHQWYAETLLLLGRYDEADRHIGRLLAESPTSPVGLHVAAFIKTVRGDTDAGLSAWRDVVRLHPDFELSILGYAYAAIAARRNADAIAQLQRLAQLVPARAALYQAIAAALADNAQRLHALQLLRASTTLAPSERAAWHVTLGDERGALDALHAGYEQHTDVNMPFLLAHPLFASLRREPAVARMITEMGIGFGK